MPELPEVETVRRTLLPVLGRTIGTVWSSGIPLRLGQKVPIGRMSRDLKGRRLCNVRRLGKYLLLDAEGSKRSLLVHLGMSGRLRVIDSSQEFAPHTHVVLKLEPRRGDQREIRYSDPRRFGQVDLVDFGHEREHPALARLGPDPLVDGLDGDVFYDAIHHRRSTIKALLLDQHLLAGVGNIYAAEALFDAEIRPTVRGTDLSRARTHRLCQSVIRVMEHALDRGGTSLRDFVNADGHQGENSHYLKVYDRQGGRCPRRGCDGRIKRQILQGRSTFHCPSCQRR